MKTKIEKSIASISITSLILQTLMLSVLLSFAPIVATADNNDFCSVDVDVVMIMDTSGSMSGGGTPSKCEWWKLEMVGPSFQCVSYKENGLTEEECGAKSNPPQCPSPQYTSPSTKKIDAAKDAANSFINNLGQNDQSAVVSFNSDANLIKNLSNDHNASKSAINGLETRGATNIGDAIDEGINELGSERGNPQANKTMVLLTDGKANKPSGPGYGEYPADVAYALLKAQEAADLGYKIFTIGLGTNSDINEEMLQQIADITGAEYHHAPNGGDLSGIYEQIAWEVCQYGSISGCKYNDVNNNGEIDEGEETLPDWEVVLLGDAELSRLTNEDGCYTFAGLLTGNYTVSEGNNEDKEPYNQTFPLEGSYDIALGEGENVDGNDFANYLPMCGNEILDEPQGEQCDDGNLEDGDGCSAVCLLEEEPILGCTDSEANNYNPEATEDDGSCTYTILGCTDPEALNYNPEATEDDASCTYSDGGIGGDSGNGGGGGGGGGPIGGAGPLGLIITEESTSFVSTTSVTITWTTNQPGTSQVVYRTEGESYSLDILAPNYGYPHAFPIPEDGTKVISHSVTINDLIPGTTYYYRVVSHSSPPALSPEYSFTMPSTEEEVGKGTGGPSDGLLAGLTTVQIEVPSESSGPSDTGTGPGTGVEGEEGLEEIDTSGFIEGDIEDFAASVGEGDDKSLLDNLKLFAASIFGLSENLSLLLLLLIILIIIILGLIVINRQRKK